MPEYSEEDKRRVHAAITAGQDTSRVHVYGYKLDEDGELVRGECSSCGNAETSNQCHGSFLCSPCLQVHGTAVKLHGGTMEFKGHLNPPVEEDPETTLEDLERNAGSKTRAGWEDQDSEDMDDRT
jgi:hypothetical protein